MSETLRDIRLALRLLRRAPAFTILCIVTLGLGIGANTAIFSVVNALLLRPLPYPDPQRLVFLDGAFSRPEGLTSFQLSYPEIADLVAGSRSFVAIAPWSTGAGLALEGTDGVRRLQPNFVGRTYFDLLGARASLGRVFTDEDHTPGEGGPMVAILSHDTWQQEFGRDMAIVGRDIRLQGRPFTVIGVMPASFEDAALSYAERIDVWVPLERAPALANGFDLTNRGGRLMWGFGRLADGVSLDSAQAELATIAARLSAAFPQSNAGFTLRAAPLADSFFRDARRPLWLLLAGSWFVLLIGCANVANLLLVRASQRTQEFAVRFAIGASRGRVVRQLLIESLLLALAGASAGLLIATWMTPGLIAASGVTVPAFAEVRLDRQVLAVGLLTATLCGALFGLAPVWRVFRANRRLGTTALASRVASRSRAAGWLLAIETTAAFVLACGALLMLQSFNALTRTDLAFRSDHLLTVRFELPLERYPTPESRVRFGDRVREQLLSLPDARAAMLWGPSMFARSTWVSFVSPAERLVPDNERLMVWRHSTNPGALNDLGIPLLAGRDFTTADRLDTPAVAIVSDASARRLWPGEPAVGKQLRAGSGPTSIVLTVVGVAADARHRGRFRFSQGAAAHEAQFDLYLPFAQRPNALVTLGVRTIGDPANAARAVAAAIAQIDPTLPAYDIAPMSDRLRLEESPVRFAALLLNLYGGLALVLAAIGVYGVLSAGVAARLKELAIRSAIGAEPSVLLRSIVKEGVAITAMAVVVGAAMTVLLGSSTRALFFEAQPLDAKVLGAAAAILLVVAVAASLVPARRAARVELLGVLKND